MVRRGYGRSTLTVQIINRSLDIGLERQEPVALWTRSVSVIAVPFFVPVLLSIFPTALLDWVLGIVLVVLLAPSWVDFFHLGHGVFDCAFEGGSVVCGAWVDVECPCIGVYVVARKHLGVGDLFAGNDGSVVGSLDGLDFAGDDGFAVDLEYCVSLDEGLINSFVYQTGERGHS